MASFRNPISTNLILGDITQIRELLTVLAKVNPSLATDIPEGAVRIVPVAGTTAKLFRIERYESSKWVSMGQLDGSSNSLAGYTPSTTAKPNTIPVYNASGQLVGNITGNAATATKLATARTFQVGGIAASTAQSFNGTANVTIPINSITVNNSNDTALVGTVTVKHGGTGRTDGASLNVVMTSLSGDVLAKSYGNLAPMALKNFSTSLDSLIVQGNYYVTSGTTTNWDKNKFPSQYPYFNQIITSYYDNDVLQRYISLKGGAWKRSSNNKGSSWNGWVPLEYQSQHTVVYISKSGNDLNMGLSSAYPVLTMGRAFQILDGIATRGASQSILILRVGEGSWGNLSIRNKPFWLDITPYDGGAATAYSTSLPVFGNLHCECGVISAYSLVVTHLAAYYGGFVWIAAGYKRIGTISAEQHGAITIVSQNAATNVIEFLGANNVPINVHSGGYIYAQYINLKLCGNLTVDFVRVQFGGSLVVYNGQTKYVATSFSNSGRKYWLDYGAIVYTGESNGGTAWLNALPGATAGLISNSVYLNGHAMGDVKKTGDTMTGPLTIQHNGRPLIVKDTGFDRSKNPSSIAYREIMLCQDKNGEQAGTMRHNFRTDGTYEFSLYAGKKVSGAQKWCEFMMRISSAGVSSLLGPNPATGSNTNELATTWWVRQFYNSNKPSVNNTTLTGVTLNNSNINYSTTRLTGTPAFMEDVAKNGNMIANIYYVHQMGSNQFYGMCPAPSIDTGTYRYNTGYTAPANGYVMASFTGLGYTQYWRCGPTSSSYNHIPTDDYFDGPITIPVQKTTYFMVYDGAASGAKIGWKPAIGMKQFSGSRPNARMIGEGDDDMHTPQPGMGYIYLLINEDKVDAYGDLPALAGALGMNYPNPDLIFIDADTLTYYMENGLKELAENKEKAVEELKRQYEEDLKTVEFEVDSLYDALAIDEQEGNVSEEEKEEDTEVPLEERKRVDLQGRKQTLDALYGEKLAELEKTSQKAEEDFQAEYKKFVAEEEQKVEEQRRKCIEMREKIFLMAADNADMVIPGDVWDQNDCHAHLEDGKIVLGPSIELREELLSARVNRKLQTYYSEINTLERQKRFAKIAESYPESQQMARVVSRFAETNEYLDQKIFEWDLYAAALVTLPEQKGYPWDGGGSKTPWPQSPLDKEPKERTLALRG